MAGQLRSVVLLMTGGDFRVEVPNDGTSSISASESPATSRISRASSSNPFVLAVRYARGSPAVGQKSTNAEAGAALTEPNISQDSYPGGNVTSIKGVMETGHWITPSFRDFLHL